MAITQLSAVKALPYVLSNLMSLFTVLPLAIAVIAFMKVARILCYSRTISGAGVISYEIYLVHAFTLGMAKESIVWICAFIAVTVLLAVGLHKMNKLFLR